MKKLIVLVLLLSLISCREGWNPAQANIDDEQKSIDLIDQAILSGTSPPIPTDAIIYSLVIQHNTTGKVEIEYSDFQGNIVQETVYDSNFVLLFIPDNIKSKFVFRAKSLSTDSNTLMVIAIRYRNKIRIIETVLRENPKGEVIFDNRIAQSETEYILSMYGTGNYKVTLKETAFDFTIKTFEFNLDPNDIGFTAVVGGGAFGISFPCDVILNNIDQSTAMYFLGDYDLSIAQVRPIVGVFGTITPLVEGVTIHIDSNGVISD